jgi:hypothetical protein
MGFKVASIFLIILLNSISSNNCYRQLKYLSNNTCPFLGCYCFMTTIDCTQVSLKLDENGEKRAREPLVMFPKRRIYNDNKYPVNISIYIKYNEISMIPDDRFSDLDM